MGVSNLWKILSPSACKVSMEEIRGLRIGVDTSIWLCQFLAMANSKTSTQTLVLRGFFHRILKLLNFRIKPVFVFDGKVPQMKSRTIEYRRKLLRDQTKRIKGLAKKAVKRTHSSGKPSKKTNVARKPSISNILDEYDPPTNNIIVPPPPPSSSSSDTHFFSFALPGLVTGEVDFNADNSEDSEEEEEKEESFQETVDRVYVNIVRDGEASFDNFFRFSDEVKREVFYMLKAAIVEQNQGKDMSSDAKMNPEQFSIHQRKEFVDEERNRERIVLKSIMTFEKESKKKGILAEGALDGNPDLLYRVEKDNVEEGSSSSAHNSKFGDPKNVRDEDDDDDLPIIINGPINQQQEQQEISNNNNNNNNNNQDDKDDDFDDEFLELLRNEDKDNEDTIQLLDDIDSLLKEEEERIGIEELEEIIPISSEEEEEEEDNNSNIQPPPPPKQSQSQQQQQHIFPFERKDYGDLEDQEEIEGEEEDEDESMFDHIDFVVKNELQTGIKSLLKMLGIPFIQSPYESDSQCGFLYRQKLVDAVVSQDSDMFLFGVGKVFRNFFSGKKMMEMYSLDLIREQLGLDRAKMVQLAYLLGSDYTDGIKHVGIVHSMEILDAFCNNNRNNKEKRRKKKEDNEDIDVLVVGLKKFYEWVKNEDDNDNNNKRRRKKKKKMSDEDEDDEETRRKEFERKYKKGKKRFVSLDEERHNIPFPNMKVAKEYFEATVNSSKQQFHWTPLENVDKVKLYQFSTRYMKLSKDEIDHFLEPVLKNRSYISGRQKEIGSYFPRRVKKVAVINSKRLKKAVNRMKKKKNDGVEEVEEEEVKKKKKRKRRRKKKKKDNNNNDDDDGNPRKRKRRKT